MYVLEVIGSHDLEQAGRLRYTVYVEQERVMPANPARLILDAFDREERTYTLLVWRATAPDPDCPDAAPDRGRPVATLRLTVGGPWDPFPAEEICPIDDIKAALRTRGARIANVGMLAIDREERFRGLLGALLCYAYTIGRAQGATHLIAPVASEIRPTMEKLGLRMVRKVRPRHIQNDVFLMVGDRDTIEERILERVPAGFEAFAQACRRVVYLRGERMCARGAGGAAAWGIVSGHARFRFGNKEGYIWPGEIAGELLLIKKLLGGESVGRTADLEPASRIVTTMEIPEDVFARALEGTPPAARGLLLALADRIVKTDLALEGLDHQVRLAEELRTVLLRYGYGLLDSLDDLTLEMAADEIGVDVATLRPLWGQLSAAGTIRREQGRLVVDAEALRAFDFRYRLGA